MLPKSFPQGYIDEIPTEGLARVVADYIAGMTDAFILQQYAVINALFAADLTKGRTGTAQNDQKLLQILLGQSVSIEHMASHQKRALVTGGAGLIGSHIVDLLVREGWTVRILDNLEPQTHKNGKPEWVNPKAEFRQGFVQDFDTMHSALEDIDVVFHEAAYGGYMPEMAKYVLVNSFGTAQMLEIIRDKQLPIKKVVVASSQAVY